MQVVCFSIHSRRAYCISRTSTAVLPLKSRLPSTSIMTVAPVAVLMGLYDARESTKVVEEEKGHNPASTG